ncbi:response regulator transcription factor [Clostridium sporogenes]|nr:response regulator transcription factor [Clostridium sporogenes]NFG69898.1 response regulator transcription factor [Clostridium sporogenes]
MTNLKAKIIGVSAYGHEREKVTALDCEVDDYLTKPLSVAELLARIRAILRHFNQDNKNICNKQSLKMYPIR